MSLDVPHEEVIISDERRCALGTFTDTVREPQKQLL